MRIKIARQNLVYYPPVNASSYPYVSMSEATIYLYLVLSSLRTGRTLEGASYRAAHFRVELAYLSLQMNNLLNVRIATE